MRISLEVGNLAGFLPSMQPDFIADLSQGPFYIFDAWIWLIAVCHTPWEERGQSDAVQLLYRALGK